MKLDEAQKRQVAGWIEQGAKIAEIQTRIAKEFGVSLTYMDTRFLVDDLKLIPKDPEPVKVPELPAAAPAQPAPAAAPEPAIPTHNLDEPALPAGTGAVSVSVDQLARPGTLISGKVTFSDGQGADWSLDQMGRLGLAAHQKGYRPSQADVQQFQQALQNELARMGF
jgi:hypothetical protein